jgi:hypothetical protein
MGADHDKDDHTPRELSETAHMRRHLVCRHYQDWSSDPLPNLLAAHAGLHLGYAPVDLTPSKSAYLDAMDHDGGER